MTQTQFKRIHWNAAARKRYLAGLAGRPIRHRCKIVWSVEIQARRETGGLVSAVVKTRFMWPVSTMRGLTFEELNRYRKNINRKNRKCKLQAIRYNFEKHFTIKYKCQLRGPRNCPLLTATLVRTGASHIA